MYSRKEIWNVGYPILLGLLAQNVVNVTDTAFLGRVGEVELGASAMGGLLYICVYTIAFGFSIGSQIMIARRNGEGRYADIGSIMMQGCLFLLGVAVVIFFTLQLTASSFVRMLISSEVIYEASLEYLHWRMFGFFFSFVTIMFRALYVGITRTKVLTMNALVMAAVNVVLDYLLIFGHCGFPEMGLKGAALASVIAEMASLVFCVVYTALYVDTRKYGLNRRPRTDIKLLRRILSISCFTMIQNFLSMSIWFVFFMALERLGQRELAIANIIRSVYVVLLIPVQALSTTTNTLVSNILGHGRPDEVMPLMHRITGLSLLTVAICVGVMLVFPKEVLSIYTNDVVLQTESVPSLYVIGGAMLIASVSMIYFSGISGTGNTRAALYLESGTLFFYTASILWIGLGLRAPVAVCFSCEVIYYILLLLSSLVYLKRAHWQNRKV